MNRSFPSESTIRQYLLGRLDDQDELEKSLSEQMLLDDELSEIVDSIEDEIIEDYLDGRLNAADNQAVDGYFLRPAERKDKLQFARLLRDHSETRRGVVAERNTGIPAELVPKITSGRTSVGLIAHWRSHFGTYCGVAALVLVSVSSLIYIARLRQGLQSQIEANHTDRTRLERELAQERELSASLTGQLQRLQPPVAMLTILPAFRGGAGASSVEIRPWTQRIGVGIALQGTSAGEYDVRLKTKAGKLIWSQAKLSASGGGLRFELPVQGITTGAYCFIVSSRPEPYCFHAKVTN
jgi:hypothetical protein